MSCFNSVKKSKESQFRVARAEEGKEAMFPLTDKKAYQEACTRHCLRNKSKSVFTRTSKPKWRGERGGWKREAESQGSDPICGKGSRNPCRQSLKGWGIVQLCWREDQGQLGVTRKWSKTNGRDNTGSVTATVTGRAWLRGLLRKSGMVDHQEAQSTEGCIGFLVLW